MHLIDTRLDPAGVLQGWLRGGKDQGVIVLDRHGVIQGWLAGAEEILGFSAQEAVGHHIALIFTHEDRSKGYPDHELRVASSDRYSEDSRWHVRRDGVRVWITGTVTAVRQPGSSEVQGFVKLIRDATDDRTHVEGLENQVAELAAAQDGNRRALRSLGHELRNPLSVLVAATGVLERVTTNDHGVKALKLLAQQVDVLRKLADDLSDLARPDPGRMQLALARIDLRDVLAAVAEAMQPLAEEKAITIHALLPPGAQWVMADTARMRQVVGNLVGNAIKFGNRGGGVWLSVTEEGDDVVCRVVDDGLGIFPPVLPRLFDLFSHEAEGESEGEGRRRHEAGVGLLLVRQLVELHGGMVHAKSAGLGKGSEFSFRLPRADAGGAPKA